MNLAQAQQVAKSFGAQSFAGTESSPAAQCWIDRVMQLQMMADRGASLGDHVDDCNRYCGRVFFASAGAKRKRF